MNKPQKLTVLFCLLTSASVMFGQAAKTSSFYASSVAYLAGLVFIILAAINAVKAYDEKEGKNPK
ncbi:MAG: hypothetical protein ABFC94_06070 [Syntrophomonas sp.]